ncbi:MAG: DMT family transporter [Treponema sp.]|jgi:drug/metabolite transporter (DMT)-like permease|nr:DMT family transporter [Treponema sp.]
MKNESRLSGQTAIFLCAVLWSTAGLFITLIPWEPLVIAGGRSFLAVVFLLVYRRITVKKEIIEGQKPLSLFVLFGGGINYALTMILFVIANKMTSPANAILLQYAAPIWAALLGWLVLKEKPQWQQWVSLAMVGGGMFVFFRNSLGGGALTGDLLAFISGITFAANAVFMRKAKNHSPVDIMICANIMTALVSIPFYVMYPPVLSAGSLFSILFLGFFQIGAAVALFSYGIKKVTSVQAMLIATIEPVLSPVWVLLGTWMLLKAAVIPSTSTIIGGSIIVIAVLFSSLTSRQGMVKRKS